MKTKCPFLRNLWVDLARDQNTNPNLFYQEDWSFLSRPNKKGIEEYKRLCDSEFDDAWFTEVSNDLPKEVEEIRPLARNRMVLGAIRYGKLSEKEYEKYDLELSIVMRDSLAIETETYEPFIDAYNFCYLNWLRSKEQIWKVKARRFLVKTLHAKRVLLWKLGHIDDGVHSVKIG